MEPIWLFKMFIAHFHSLLFYRIKSLVFPVPCHQTTILRTQRPYFYKMTTALVEALYLKLFEIQCFPAFSISSYWYYFITLLSSTSLKWLSLSKKKPAVYLLTTDFLYYSFYLLRCVSDNFFIFKHNLCFPAIPLHTTWFQHIPVARIIREIAYWLAKLSLSKLQSRLLFPCL